MQGDRGARRSGDCKKAALPELRQCGLGSCFGSGVAELIGGFQLAAVFCLRVERGQEEQRVDSRDDGQDDQDAGKLKFTSGEDSSPPTDSMAIMMPSVVL